MFGTNAGLSQGSIYGAERDSMGYMWVATSDGLNRFDGRRFKTFNYNPLDTNSLLGTYLNNVIVYNKANVFIGSNKGLSYYDAVYNKFYTVNYDNKAFNDTYLLDLSGDTLLFLNENGVYRISAASRKIYNVDNSFRIFSQYNDSRTIAYSPAQKTIYVAAKDGLIGYNTQTHEKIVRTYADSMFTKRQVSAVNQVSVSGTDKLAMATNNGLLLLNIPSLSVASHITHPKPGDNFLNGVGTDLDGRIWVGGSDTCLYMVEGNQFKKVEISSSELKIKFKEVNKFAFSPKNIFIGEEGKGLGRLQRPPILIESHTPLNSYFMRPYLPNSYCFAEDEEGKIWIGKRLDGILIYDTYTKNAVDIEEKYGIKLPVKDIKSLLIHGNVYIGTINGLYMLDRQNRKLTLLEFANPVDDNFDSRWCNHIIKNKSGEILVGTRKGIFRVDQQSKKLVLIDSLRTYAYFMLENKQGQIVTTVNTSDLIVFDYTNGQLIERNRHLGQFSVMGLWQNNNNGDYWLACREGIIHAAEDFKLIKFYNPINDGLKSSTFYGVVPDHYGNIWISSNHGIITINLKTLQPGYMFSDLDYSGLEYNGKGFLRSKAGKLYFGSEGGFDIIDPMVTKMQYNNSYRLIVEDMLLNNSPVSDALRYELSRGIVKLKHSQNTISFLINAVNCDNDFEPMLQYRVAELSDKWINFRPGEPIRFSQLRPGNYTLNVRAENNLAAPITISVNIIPAFYQTLWFLGLCVLLLAGLFYLAYRWRLRSIQKVYLVRQQISKDLHDDIGASLSSINMYSEVAAMNPKPEFIALIRKNTYEVLQKLDDIIWATNPRHDTGDKVIERINDFARNLLQSKGINFHLEADEHFGHLKLKEGVRQNLFLIAKEAINNAAKYADAAEIRVKLTSAFKIITLYIADDGAGFDTMQSTDRNGLLNMQARTEYVGGKFNIVSRPGEGTEILVKIPY